MVESEAQHAAPRCENGRPHPAGGCHHHHGEGGPPWIVPLVSIRSGTVIVHHHVAVLESGLAVAVEAAKIQGVVTADKKAHRDPLVGACHTPGPPAAVAPTAVEVRAHPRVPDEAHAGRVYWLMYMSRLHEHRVYQPHMSCYDKRRPYVFCTAPFMPIWRKFERLQGFIEGIFQKNGTKMHGNFR